MKDMETDILKNVYIVGNPVLEAALKKFNEEMDQGEPNIVPVFDLMVEQMKEDVEVICPVNGVTSTFTGFLKEPYSDRPDTCGKTSFSYDFLKKSVIEMNAAGFGVRLHCIGDAAVEWALDAYEASRYVNDCSNIRNTIEHIETIDPADIHRFKQLDVTASMQPKHIPLDMNEKISRVGAERCKTEWAFKSILQAGGNLAFGTDFPIVNFDPFDSIYYAVVRNGFDRKPTGVNPEETVSLYEALRAYTWGGAYLTNREKELGTLEPGKLADICVLDRNLFEVDVEEIPDTKVVMTMYDGEVVYSA